MQKGDYLTTILRSPKTVFTFKDIVLLWRENNINAIRVRLSYYVRKGDLVRIRRGFYSKQKDYDKLELATRIFSPSYISFETVLAREGMIFQYYSQIMLASYLTREVAVDGQNYSYRKIKNEILMNEIGIEQKNEVAIATKERAFLDTIYRSGSYYCDNLRPLDWQKVFEILPHYHNQSMNKIVHRIYKQSAINN